MLENVPMLEQILLNEQPTRKTEAEKVPFMSEHGKIKVSYL